MLSALRLCVWLFDNLVVLLQLRFRVYILDSIMGNFQEWYLPGSLVVFYSCKQGIITIAPFSIYHLQFSEVPGLSNSKKTFFEITPISAATIAVMIRRR